MIGMLIDTEVLKVDAAYNHEECAGLLLQKSVVFLQNIVKNQTS